MFPSGFPSLAPTILSTIGSAPSISVWGLCLCVCGLGIVVDAMGCVCGCDPGDLSVEPGLLSFLSLDLCPCVCFPVQLTRQRVLAP